MEHLAMVFAGVAAPGTDPGIIAKITEGLARAAEQLATAMVTGTVGLLRENGVQPGELSFAGFCCVAANWQLEKYRHIGLLKKAPFQAPRLKKVEQELKSDPALRQAAEDYTSLALLLDVANYAFVHYLPTRQLIEQIAGAGFAGDISALADLPPGPCSPEALACREHLARAKFIHHKTRPVIYEPRTMAELLVEPFLREEEAARIARCAPKTLADRRRGGGIDAEVLAKRVDDGIVLYNTSAWVESLKIKLEAPELPALPRAAKNRPVSTELPNLPTRKPKRGRAG